MVEELTDVGFGTESFVDHDDESGHQENCKNKGKNVERLFFSIKLPKIFIRKKSAKVHNSGRGKC